MQVFVALVLLSATAEGQLFDAEAPEPIFHRDLARMLQIDPSPSPSPNAGTPTCTDTCQTNSVRAHLLCSRTDSMRPHARAIMCPSTLPPRAAV